MAFSETYKKVPGQQGVIFGVIGLIVAVLAGFVGYLMGLVPVSGDFSYQAAYEIYVHSFQNALEPLSAIVAIGSATAALGFIAIAVIAAIRRKPDAILGGLFFLLSAAALAFGGILYTLGYSAKMEIAATILVFVLLVASLFGAVCSLVGVIRRLIPERTKEEKPIEITPSPVAAVQPAIKEPAPKESGNEILIDGLEDEDMTEERLREIIREELAKLQLGPTNVYVTLPPEQAAQAAPAPAPVPAPAPAPTPVKEEPKPIVQQAAPEKPQTVAEEKAEPAPVVKEAEPMKVEEKPVVVPVEEPKEEVAEEEDEAPEATDGPSHPTEGKKDKTPFEDKMKAAPQEVQDKYNELRDYIASYGLNPRLSIPGCTFSAHRERYIFITITGKHLRVNYALDPKDYADTTIPVIANNSKKFADIPLTFKIKSGLSFRRALKLVDDVMAKKGRSKGDAPEEE